MIKNTVSSDKTRNPDPITGERGAHPLGTTIGAISGGVAAGAALGSVGGTAGAIAGAAVGAILGGLAGHRAAEKVNPSVIEAFWRANRNQARRPERFDDFRHA